MHIAILGTGSVGRTLADRLDGLGHDVVVGTRDPDATLRQPAGVAGGEAYATWAAAHPDVGLETFAGAASRAPVVVNATNGRATLDVLRLAGADALRGKVLVDISNPLDFSGGFPPTLFVKDDDSLGEQVQRAFPDALVVKTLNTVTAPLMVRPDTLPEPTTVFVSGDDADAKAVVRGLLEQMGHTDVLDLGDISTARGAEMLMAGWLRIMGALGTAMFNYRIVR